METTGTTSQLIVKNGAVWRRPSSSSGEQQADNDDDEIVHIGWSAIWAYNFPLQVPTLYIAWRVEGVGIYTYMHGGFLRRGVPK